ncbi:MAG TPA: HAMP domain-containing histidine kinase [Candidatus Mediterraneibacter stercoripullorum]|nr:HAMP domain-containing histidine kinase [Candidatus Mediterraneibacter stercoripullorum]
MDTRSKNSRKLVVLTVIVLSICSLCMLANYGSFRTQVSRATETDSTDDGTIYGLGYTLACGNYIIYNEAVTETPLSDVLEEYGDIEFNLARKYMDCQVFDGEGSPMLDGMDAEEAQRLLDDSGDYYAFRVLYRFLEDGSLSDIQVTGNVMDPEEEYYVENGFISNADQAEGDYISDISTPAGVTIAYGMTEENLSAYGQLNGTELDSVYVVMNYTNLQSNALIFACVAAAAALLLPFLKRAGRWKGKIFEAPFEVVMFVLCCIALPLEIMSTVVSATLNGNLMNSFIGGLPTMLVNFAGWFLFFGIVFWIAACLREVFTMGTAYWKERTLTARVIRRLKEGEGSVGRKIAEGIKDGFRSVKRFFAKQYDALLHLDFQDKTNRTILRVVLINFAILVVVCMFWFYGIFALIVYSVLLFLFLRKYMNDLQDKYKLLLQSTNQLAEGHLDVPIEGDVGLFNPIQDELKKIQKGFRKAVEEEVKNERMKTELVTNVSHDLRTPLTAIITYVDLLKHEKDDEKRNEYIAVLERKSLRLKVLIEDLFEISKAASKSVVMHYMKVDIVDLLKQVELENDSKIKGANLEFRWKLPDHKLIMWLDSQKTYRIFENLIVNITKYAMPHTRVYVEMTEREEGVHISMKNVSACELTFDTEEITDRFVRGDSSRNTEGSGLGLAIAKSFVELQHGTLKISTEADLFKADIDLPKMEMPEEARKEQEELEAMRWQQEEAFGSCDEPDAEDNQVEKEEDQLVIAEKEETQHREN